MSNFERKRAREYGIHFGTLPTGKTNSILDVSGVRVGQKTLISGEGKLVPGISPVRTGITVVFPHSNDTFIERVAGSIEYLNGFGECFGSAFVREFGFIIGPIVLTNSFNVYRVGDALQDWSIEQHPDVGITGAGLICLVTECDDSYLNDAQGRHVKKEDVYDAINNASSEIVAEGSVGAGTGMDALGFKSGIGTASRILPKEAGEFTVGSLILANFGSLNELTISGVPVGQELIQHNSAKQKSTSEGSIVIIIGTDAPLNARQLNRLAKRATLGMSRTGGIAHNESGDIAIAFSNATTYPRYPKEMSRQQTELMDFSGDVANYLFQATVEVVEEAIINSLFMSDTMRGRDNHEIKGLPIAEVLSILQKYGKLH